MTGFSHRPIPPRPPAYGGSAEAERLRRIHTPKEIAPMNTDKNEEAAKLTIEERDARILELHAKGNTERAIASEVGVSRTTVWSAIQRAKKARA